MRRILIIVAAVLAVLVAAIIILPFVVPKDAMVAYVAEEVEKATGRKLTVGPNPGFSVFPDVKLTMENVSLTNAPGGEAPYLVSVKSAEVSVGLLSALSGNVVVKQFVLVEPVIAIEKDSKGRFNFEFEPAAGSAPATATGDRSTDSDSSGGGGLPLRLDDVRLENATFSYADATTGQKEVLSGINAKLSLPDFAGPFDMEASADWKERTITVTAHVAKPQALSAGEETALKVGAASDGLFNVTFNGSASAGTAPKGAGRLSAELSDIAALMNWAGVPMDPGMKLPATAGIDANVAGDPASVALTDTTIAFDQNRLTGAIRAGLGGKRPSLFADLAGGNLDLRPYMPASGEQGGKDGAAAPAGGAGTDWSDDPIDLSALDTADVDMHLAADSIRTGLVDTAATDVKLVSKGGRTDLTISKLELYDGEATSRVTINRLGSRPAFTIKFDMAGLQAQPALKQFADFGDFLGTANASIDLKTEGASERELVSALNGQGSVTVVDGAILGYNLAAAVRNISRGGLDLTYDSAEKTDFAEMGGTFTAAKGVITNNDFAMKAPLLRVTGKGTVSLPPRQIDYRVLTKLVASLSGQGGSDTGGVGIPIRIRGSLDDPSIQPDLEGVVKGVLQAPGDVLKGAAEGSGGAVKGLLDSVTGGKSQGNDGTTDEGAADKNANPLGGAAKKLKGLFGD